MQSNDSQIQELSTPTPEQIQCEPISKPANQILISSDLQKATRGQQIDDSLRSILYKREYENAALLVEKEKLEKFIDQLKKDNESLKMELKNGINQSDRMRHFFDQEKKLYELSQRSLKKLEEAKEAQLFNLTKLYRKQFQRSSDTAQKLNQVIKQNIRLETDEKHLKKKLKTTNSIIAILVILFIGACIFCSSLFLSNVGLNFGMRQLNTQLGYSEMYYNKILEQKTNNFKTLQMITSSKRNQCSIM